MRPLFILGLMGAGAIAALAAGSLKPSLDGLPARIPDEILTAEANASPWRNAAMIPGEAGAFGNAMLTGATPEGVTVMAGAAGHEKTAIHVMPTPQGGLLLLSDSGRWTYVADPAALRGALDALAAAGRPQDL